MLTISIKYCYFDKDSILDFLYEIENVFSEYNWGGGYHLTNFRVDGGYFYCDMESKIFNISSDISEKTAGYITGMISGYLLAKGIEII